MCPDFSRTPAGSARALEPDVRGAGALRFLERLFLYLDRFLGRALPESMNPFLHSGEVTVTALLVAAATGVPLLFWYRPSVHLAWQSVHAMDSQPWGSGLLRSLHRYSSDVAIFFTIVHALRVSFERRFTGARWLAWVTGLFSVLVTWAIGWTGYWLVWDVRAHAVAAGTARALDVLPIFADPMGRAFLIDETLNSLLFFVVFFLHMLVPLAVVILLWLHLARLARPRFLARRPLAIWTLILLVVLSVGLPAGTAAPARMMAIRGPFTMDAWYLAPLYLTDRLDGALLWLTLLVAGTMLGMAPWWSSRRRRGAAQIHVPRCNACGQCVADCPFDAITLVPRTDGSELYSQQAEVNPARCVDCGICAASCDSVSTDLEWFGIVAGRERLEGWVRQAVAGGEAPVAIFSCAEAAGGELDVDPVTGRCDALPGACVLQVPCSGWVHSLSVERALRFGAGHVVIVTCGPGQCHHREGDLWLRGRIAGAREPALRISKAPAERVRLLQLDRTRADELARVVAALRAGSPVAAQVRPGGPRAAAAALAAVLSIAVGIFSGFTYRSPRPPGSELVVTFKHAGHMSEHWHTLTLQEKARLPIQMRQDRVYDRARSAVRMRVTVDGTRVVQRTYPPKGMWHDGNSIGVETIPVSPGEHQVQVEIGDTPRLNEWNYHQEGRLRFTREARRVIVFDRLTGFTFH